MAAKEAKDLQDIKRLLIVLLVKLGATSEEIGLALGIHPGAVRKSLPIGKIKPLTLQK
jgi:DNA-binding CsgD family transcriptional regulator